MHNNPLNLTFGVEIECIILFDPEQYEAGIPKAEGLFWDKKQSIRLPHDTKLQIICRNHIIQVLRNANFNTYGYNSPKGDQKWTVEPDASISIADGRRDDGYLECDVEIISPALRYCPAALRRVKRLIEVLETNFAVQVNTSCGFHVHVGNRRKGFPLQTIKHLCMLTACFEHQFDSLHPANRIGNELVKTPSRRFKGQNPWDTVALVQGCRSRAQLVRLFAGSGRCPDRCWAYNLLPLVTGRQKTVEFRQHRGTLKWREMNAWVQTAAGVVNAMHEISIDALARLICACAFDRTFNVLDLFRRLELEAVIPFYFGNVYVHPRIEPLWIPRGKERYGEAGSAGLRGCGRVEELEKRHRLERFTELKKLEERHELERQRVLER